MNTQSFWSKISKDGQVQSHCPDIGKCWVWLGAVDRRGRGYFGAIINGHRERLASRVAYRLLCGDIRSGLCVLHRCDNPNCVRPEHLWLGTQLDNITDRDKKGRQVSPTGNEHGLRSQPWLAARGEHHGSKTHPERLARGDRHGSKTHPECLRRGENHPNAKLNPRTVIRMKAMRQHEKLSYGRIGAIFSVTKHTARKAICGMSWIPA